MNHATGRLVSLALLLLGTVTAGTWYKKDILDTYSENLAVHRRKLKVAKTTVRKKSLTTYKKKTRHIVPTHAINDQLNYLLARKKAVHEQAKYVQGYTIQVYSGGSREEAFGVKNKLHTHYPAITPEVTYHLPNYTVRLGKFLEKLEAYPVYAAIRKIMPRAIIRPTSFINQPYLFINKQTTDPRHPISSTAATNEPPPSE